MLLGGGVSFEDAPGFIVAGDGSGVGSPEGRHVAEGLQRGGGDHRVGTRGSTFELAPSEGAWTSQKFDQNLCQCSSSGCDRHQQ